MRLSIWVLLCLVQPPVLDKVNKVIYTPANCRRVGPNQFPSVPSIMVRWCHDGDRHVNRFNDQGEASNNLLKPPFRGVPLGMGASQPMYSNNNLDLVQEYLNHYDFIFLERAFQGYSSHLNSICHNTLTDFPFPLSSLPPISTSFLKVCVISS